MEYVGGQVSVAFDCGVTSDIVVAVAELQANASSPSKTTGQVILWLIIRWKLRVRDVVSEQARTSYKT